MSFNRLKNHIWSASTPCTLRSNKKEWSAIGSNLEETPEKDAEL